MEVNTVTKTVEVTISNAVVLDIFVQAIYGDAQNSTGKGRTFYKALGHLVGISDVQAVGRANYDIMDEEDHITVEEFQRWLPTKFAEFARAMLEATDD